MSLQKMVPKDSRAETTTLYISNDSAGIPVVMTSSGKIVNGVTRIDFETVVGDMGRVTIELLAMDVVLGLPENVDPEIVFIPKKKSLKSKRPINGWV